MFLWLELSDIAAMFAQDAYPSRSGYLSAFFGLVPLHGLHVFAGLVWLLVMVLQVALMGANDIVKVRLLPLSLFWHFLDIIWIGIFSHVKHTQKLFNC